MTKEITSINIQSSCSRFAWQDSIEPLRQTLSLSEPTGMTEVIGEIGVVPTEVRMSGGGSDSQLWRQIHADVFDTPVVTMSGAAEGGAYGAALLAGVGSGVWGSLKEATEVLKVENSNTPIAENVKRYSEMYGIFHELYPALKDTFEAVSMLHSS